MKEVRKCHYGVPLNKECFSANCDQWNHSKYAGVPDSVLLVEVVTPEPQKANSPMSAEEAEKRSLKNPHYAAVKYYAANEMPVFVDDDPGRQMAIEKAFVAGDANGYARAQAEGKEREEKLREALKEHKEFMQGCRDAAFSNLEGADEKEFIYWNNWATDCIAQIKKIAVAVARKETK